MKELKIKLGIGFLLLSLIIISGLGFAYDYYKTGEVAGETVQGWVTAKAGSPVDYAQATTTMLGGSPDADYVYVKATAVTTDGEQYSDIKDANNEPGVSTTKYIGHEGHIARAEGKHIVEYQDDYWSAETEDTHWR